MNEELCGIFGVLMLVAFIGLIFVHPSVILLYFVGFLFYSALQK